MINIGGFRNFFKIVIKKLKLKKKKNLNVLTSQKKKKNAQIHIVLKFSL